MNNMWILAQTSGEKTDFDVRTVPLTETEEGERQALIKTDPNAVVTRTPEQKPFGNTMWLIWIVLMLVMFFVLFRGPQKQKQERKKLVQSLQKNDRVQTIGGILGTIVDIKGDEITLKVDESNNTKIKVVSSAIGRNLSQDKA
jgi:preprotein translocase subunit YajC